MEYRNYIFDLYGTLVDIRTDEGRPEFWQKIAGWYCSYGAEWTEEEIRKAYLSMVREEEEKLAAFIGSAFPEISLETVFLRLLEEAPDAEAGSGLPAIKKGRGAKQKPRGIRAEAAWVKATATMFRVLSRDRLRCFEGVPEMLRSLGKQGKRIFLLSNAQSVFTIPELEQCGIADCFDDIFISSDRGIKKPDPRFLQELMQKHAMDPAETVMIGNDPDTDMAVAAACGVRGILVSSDGSDLLTLLP
jgi:putative hydrolase of the HAD superfamily